MMLNGGPRSIIASRNVKSRQGYLSIRLMQVPHYWRVLGNLPLVVRQLNKAEAWRGPSCRVAVAGAVVLVVGASSLA